MTQDDNKNKPNSKNSPDREPDEVLDLLQKFYQPESAEMEEFTGFYDSIEKKLTEQNPVSRITQSSNAIENNLNDREQKLSQYVRRLEQKKVKRKVVTPIKPKLNFSLKKIFTSILILALIALASIANLRNMQHDNHLNLEGDSIDWKILNLNQKQENKLQEIDQSWRAFQASELSTIEKCQSKLRAEMSEEKPDFSLIDKYQRDILDHEVAIKRERLNSFLEKRFLLDEEQSLKLVKAMTNTKIK